MYNKTAKPARNAKGKFKESVIKTSSKFLCALSIFAVKLKKIPKTLKSA